MVEEHHRRRPRWWAVAVVAAVVLVLAAGVVIWWERPLLQRVEALMTSEGATMLGEVVVTSQGVEILYVDGEGWATADDHGGETETGLAAGHLAVSPEELRLDEFETLMDEARCDSDDKEGHIATTTTGSVVANVSCRVDDELRIVESRIDDEPVPPLEDVEVSQLDDALETFARAQDPTVYHVLLELDAGPVDGVVMLASSRLADCALDTTVGLGGAGSYIMGACGDHDIPAGIDFDDFELTELTGDRILDNIDRALEESGLELDDIASVSFYVDDDALRIHVSFEDPAREAWIEPLA